MGEGFEKHTVICFRLAASSLNSSGNKGRGFKSIENNP